jgi:ribosomal protein L39E
MKVASYDHRQVGYTVKAHPDGRAYDDDDDDDDDSSRSQYYYKPEPNAGPILESCKFTEKQINFFLNKRRECKRTKQFDKADQILIGLNQNGVYVHDKRREWRADGENYFGRSVYNIHNNYVLRGGTYDLLTEKNIQDVSKLLEARSKAKRNKEYPRSDGITVILKTKYNVKVDDKNREWSVQHNPTDTDSDTVGNDHMYVPSPLAPLDHPTHTMSDELKTQIAQQLSDRVSLRKEKDYSSADKIRDELMEKYSIVIDDRTKEWKVVEFGDDENVDNVDDPFVNGANLSQRSAFVREGNDRNNNYNNVETSNNGSVSEKQDHELASSPLSDDLDISLSKIFSDEEIIDEDEENNDFVESEEQLQQKKIELLNSLTVIKLKEQLREAGLPVSGKKTDLIERLLINT